MFYTTYWTAPTSPRKETDLPLAMLESLAARGGARRLTIVVLDAPNQHLHELKQGALDAGAAVEDARSLFGEMARQHPLLARRFSPFEVACFLRWLVLHHLIRNATAQQVWHVDSDMVFFARLDEIAQDTAGKTFVLQGCPAFASIADPGWFDVYERALRALNDTGEPGFRVTDETRARHRTRDADSGNASVYRIPLASDQDLIECVAAERLLPQAAFSDIRGSQFYFTQNPLCLGPWHARIAAKTSSRFRDADGGIHLEERRIPFVHFQADAARFFRVFERARLLRVTDWLPHPLSHPTDLYSTYSRRYRLAARLLLPRGRIDRALLMKRAMQAPQASETGTLTSALNHLLDRCNFR